jgi:UDP-N-acetylglucosamine 4,6-dehydratase/5-epimerase
MNFTKQIVAITGGTGSFGKALLGRLLKTDVKQILILSRDEEKQDAMRRSICDSRIIYIIADIRFPKELVRYFEGVDYVFHAAALKQVPSCEFFPEEAIRTNVHGTSNVVEACVKNKVKAMVLLSTDKAVYPINSMGMTKALAEKTVQAWARKGKGGTRLIITRYGNVMGSRGSVIPYFASQCLKGEELTITNPNMTRFMMSLEESVELVLYAFDNGASGEVFVMKSPAATVENIAKAVSKLTNVNYKHKIIGERHGEKVYETLISKEEMHRAEDMGGFYRIRLDDRGLDYDLYFTKGEEREHPEYNSHNTKRLSLDETAHLLSSNKIIKE